MSLPIQSATSVFVACDYGFEPGDLVTVCCTRQMNGPFEIVSIRRGNLGLAEPSPWYLLKVHFIREWKRFLWWIDDAYLELCDLWDEAKRNWINI